MQVFHCQRCENLLYFENVLCERCKSEQAFLPSAGTLIVLPQGREPPPASARKCQNYTEHGICNWAIEADDPNPLCASCRLTTVIPNLEVSGNLEAWKRLEGAKRRLLYSLLQLKLPLKTKAEDAEAGLQFKFMTDQAVPNGDRARVLTGHDDGTIVINAAEADDAERERRRVNLNEPYRTLLGHMRHEIGHYYWDRLIRDSSHLADFRAIFGDERADYGKALEKHYADAPSLDWQQNYISNYASSHPLEDWAETWAHCLHIGDTLETADACGLTLNPRRIDEPSLQPMEIVQSPVDHDFDDLFERWLSVTYLLNSLNRGLGLADAYPFILSPRVLEKLKFVYGLLHDIVIDTAAAA